MTNPLKMIELRLNKPALFQFSHEQGLNKDQDSDLGYLSHAWLKAMFQELAPQPFRLYGGESPRILGYSEHTGQALAEQAQAFATPLTLGVTQIDDLQHTKALPDFKEGRRLGFEVLCCPITRKGNVEKDAFLHRLESLAQDEARNSLTRERVYLEWLSKKMDTVTIEELKLEKFQLVTQYRKGETKKRGRSKYSIRRPQVLFRGVLRVEDEASFNQLLARGVGRHRSFGYGMILLRPA